MNIIFLMLDLPNDLESSNLYLDLALEFKSKGHNVYVITPSVLSRSSNLEIERGLCVLRVKTLKQLGVKSILRKGIAQFLLPFQFKKAYKKFIRDIKIDLILMPTPPITLISFIKYIKKRTSATFYLILRDIYPQGAADIGLVKFKLVYTYLKYLERSTYMNADYIGCMSQGNIDYIRTHNPYVIQSKLKLLPNWQKPYLEDSVNSDVRKKYQMIGKYIVLFGGTIGYAQKVDNIITLGQQYKKNDKIVFLVIGKGVMKGYLEAKVNSHKLSNVIIFDSLPRNEYLKFVKASDIGLISIDERFTVPTIPSKTTTYMNFKLPILAIIDSHTDYGKILDENHAGLWSVGGDNKSLFNNFDLLYSNATLRIEMGENGYHYFINDLTSGNAYQRIMNSLNG